MHSVTIITFFVISAVCLCTFADASCKSLPPKKPCDQPPAKPPTKPPTCESSPLGFNPLVLVQVYITIIVDTCKKVLSSCGGVLGSTKGIVGSVNTGLISEIQDQVGQILKMVGCIPNLVGGVLGSGFGSVSSLTNNVVDV